MMPLNNLSGPYPAPLSLAQPNVLRKIQSFREDWETYCFITGLDKGEEDMQVRLMKLIIGEEAKSFINHSLTLSYSEKKKCDLILSALENHFKPKGNIVLERLTFHEMVQIEGECIDLFLIRLKKQAIKCDFQDSINERLRDQFLFGFRNKNFIKRLSLNSDLTLDSAVTLCKQTEGFDSENVSNNFYNASGNGTQEIQNGFQYDQDSHEIECIYPAKKSSSVRSEPHVTLALVKIEPSDGNSDDTHNAPQYMPIQKIIKTENCCKFYKQEMDKNQRADTTVSPLTPITQEERQIAKTPNKRPIVFANFEIGDFVIAKKKIVGPDEPIWRIDNMSLLQKFEPFIHEGFKLYKSTVTYSGWSNTNPYQYEKIFVTIHSKNNTTNEMVVQLKQEVRRQQTRRILKKKNSTY